MNQFPFIFGTPWPWLPIVLAGAGAGYMTYAGYRRRAPELAVTRLKILRGMRFAGWFLLFLCLLQPIHREYVREERASRLTVLVDDSESMSFSDKRDGATRLERARKLLGGEKSEDIKTASSGLLKSLGRNFNVQLEAFSGAAKPISNVGELRAQGETTDVSKALTEAFSRLKGPDAGGLVLLSDGADTARGELERVANTFKRAGTPIYTLGIGEPDRQDLAVSQVRCRRTVSKDTLVRVEVDVSRVGVPEGKQTVTIERNGKPVGTPVTLDVKGDSATAIFEFLPDAQGFLEYQAKVAPFAGELVTTNNELAFGLMAFSRKLRVLYMEGSMFIHKIYNSSSSGLYWSHPMQSWWEHQFLERALTEDSDVEVDVLAKEAVTVPRGAQPIDHIKTVKEGYPKTKKDLYQYDVIICSDIPFTHFSTDQIQWTVDFVGKHGGGFVMIGGYDSFGEGKYAKTVVDRMLPVEMNANDDHVNDVEFNWGLTDEAWQHPIMQVEKDETKNRAAWELLPKFHGFSRTTRPKPAATTLAVVADEEQFGTAYGPAILAAVQPFGNGRSMAFTTDSTGSWGTEWQDSWGPPGESGLEDRNKYFKTFWKNAVRWLAHYRMQAPNQLVQLETDRLVYNRGEPPEVRVKVMNEDYELTHEAKVQLTVTGPDGKTQQVTVFPRYEEAGIYERKLEFTAVGRYEVEAIAMLGKDEVGRDKSIFQIRPSSAEMRQLSQNVALLKNLAEQTGGKYLPVEKADELPQYLKEATHVVEKYRDNDLWDRAWMFALIIGLLCGEWYLRKRSGLP